MDRLKVEPTRTAIPRLSSGTKSGRRKVAKPQRTSESKNYRGGIGLKDWKGIADADFREVSSFMRPPGRLDIILTPPPPPPELPRERIESLSVAALLFCKNHTTARKGCRGVQNMTM